jgi:hypothetical protein
VISCSLTHTIPVLKFSPTAFLMPFGVILSVTALIAWMISFRSEDAASFKNGSFNATCLYTGMFDVSVSWCQGAMDSIFMKFCRW